MVALCLCGEVVVPPEFVEKREPYKDENKSTEQWHVSNLRQNSKDGPSSLERMKSPRKSPLLLAPTAGTEAQPQIKDAFRAFANYSRLENSVTTKKALLPNAEKNFEIQSRNYETAMQKLRPELKLLKLNFSKLKGGLFPLRVWGARWLHPEKKVTELRKTVLSPSRSWRTALTLWMMREKLFLTWRWSCAIQKRCLSSWHKSYMMAKNFFLAI